MQAAIIVAAGQGGSARGQGSRARHGAVECEGVVAHAVDDTALRAVGDVAGCAGMSVNRSVFVDGASLHDVWDAKRCSV